MIKLSGRFQSLKGHHFDVDVSHNLRGCFYAGSAFRRYLNWLLFGLFLLFIFPVRPVLGQKEVITRHYEDEGSVIRKRLITFSSTADKIRYRTIMADSHLGLRFYQYRSCTDCHPRQARNLHKMRAGISCRQCHGTEPIAGIKHHYSPMNPKRRHAYVCAKCHKGASSSFAKYIVHEPNPAYLATKDAFPSLFYVFWLMAAIAAGTFATFLPYMVMLGVREFLPHKFQWSIKELSVRWTKSR